MTVLKVRKVGNSLGVILPAELVSELRVAESEALYVVKDAAGGVRFTPYDPEFAAAMEAFEEGRRAYRNALRQLAR